MDKIVFQIIPYVLWFLIINVNSRQTSVNIVPHKQVGSTFLRIRIHVGILTIKCKATVMMTNILWCDIKRLVALLSRNWKCAKQLFCRILIGEMVTVA